MEIIVGMLLMLLQQFPLIKLAKKLKVYVIAMLYLLTSPEVFPLIKLAKKLQESLRVRLCTDEWGFH